MKKWFIGTSETWSAKVDAKEKELQSAQYMKEHTDNSISGNSANNSHDAYQQYLYELVSSGMLQSDETKYEPYKMPEFKMPEIVFSEYESTLNIITKNQLHVIFTKSIVKKLASSSRRENPACTQIVNSYFRDPIFEDLTTSVFTTMLRLYRAGEMYFDRKEKKMVFTVREKDSDKTESSYVDLYRAINSELALYKSCGYHDELILDTATTCSKISDFVQVADLERVVISEDMQNFMTYLQLREPRDYSLIVDIMCGLLAVHQYEQIGIDLGISARRVRYLKTKIEHWFKMYFHGTDKFHTVKYFKYDKNGNKKTDKDGNIKEYSYKYYMF